MMAAILLVCAAIALPWMYLRDARHQRRSRAQLFAQCLSVLQAYRVTQNGGDFPVLEGRYRGHSVKLEPVLDAVAWRKVPSLWLKVTVLAPNPWPGVLDFLVRPQGVEFYSPGSELAHAMRVPPSWPQHAVLNCDDPQKVPPLALIEPHIALFADQQMKELLITPRGTRLVRQLWQAERADYLVLRQARFTAVHAHPELVCSLLDAALAICTSLNRPAQTQAEAA
jgi:hypothetical protein